MSIPFKSLDAVAVTGIGAVHDLEDVKVDHAIQVTVTGSPTSWGVSLQGSLDNVNWITLTGINGTTKYGFTGDVPVRYVRANCTDLTGGTDPTITAWIGSA